MNQTKYGSVLGSVPFTAKIVENNTSTTMDGGQDETGAFDEQPNHQSITFADLGIPTSAILQDTVIGKARPWSDIKWRERIYALLMLISIIAAIVLTIIRLTVVKTNDPDFTFCLVLLFNAAFCIWFVIEGVLRERPSELFILTFATIIIMVYLIVNFATGAQQDVKLARLVVACLSCPVLAVFGLIIAWEYHTSKRLIFRTVGANETYQIYYRNLLVFQDFLKFDLQLGGSMIILIVQIAKDIGLRDILILSIGGVCTVAWFFLGYFTMPKEWKIGAYIFFFFSPVEFAYVIFKIYDAVQYKNDPAPDNSNGLVDSTIACGVGAIFVRLTVIVAAILVVRNFGNGLKEKLQPPAPVQS